MNRHYPFEEIAMRTTRLMSSAMLFIAVPLLLVACSDDSNPGNPAPAGAAGTGNAGSGNAGNGGGGNGGGGAGGAGTDSGGVKVGLITKEAGNPFFAKMK